MPRDNNLSLRFGNLNDLDLYTDFLQRMYQAAYTNEGLGLTSDLFSKKIFATADTQKYIRSHLVNTEAQKTWLAFEGQKIIGSVTCIILNDKEAELTGFYIDSKHQGQGLGKRLYNLALDFAGDRDLVLDLYCHNTKAIEMYKKWGWKIDTTKGKNGFFTRHWLEWPEGVEAECMYMRLKRK